jgi:hypothetical protein
MGSDNTRDARSSVEHVAEIYGPLSFWFLWRGSNPRVAAAHAEQATFGHALAWRLRINRCKHYYVERTCKVLHAV